MEKLKSKKGYLEILKEGTLSNYFEKVYIILKNKEMCFYIVTEKQNKLKGCINFDLYNVKVSRVKKQDR